MNMFLRILFLCLIGSSVKGSSFEEMVEKHQIQKAHYLAYYNNIEALALFIINHDETVNARDLHGNTALHYASYFDRKSIVKLLLDNGADVEIKNKLGHTPLFHACMKSNQDVIILLCERKADIYAANIKGQTPMSIASEHIQDILSTVSFFNTNSLKAGV